MKKIVATALLVLFTLVCCLPPSAAEPCGGFTDMRLYVACLQNHISSGCGHACETNMIEQCPRDTYSVGDYCMPKSKTICPNKAVYINGSCQIYERPSCPPHFTYNNGVCVGLVPETPCKQNSTNCTITINQCQGAFGSCNYPTTCLNELVLFNGSCVLPEIAKCPELMTLVNGICVRQKLPCEKTGNCTRSCPTESKMVNGTCIRVSPCPEGSFQIGGICAKCPLGSFYAVGGCLSCPTYMVYENDLCVCPGDTILFNNTCMESGIDGSGDGGDDGDEKSTTVETETDSGNENPDPIEPEIDDYDGEIDDDKDYLLPVTTEKTNIPTTKKVVRGNQLPGPYKYTHIFNLTENTNLEESSDEIDNNEECCLIIEPVQCEKSGLKYRCIKRRRHVCGDRCKEEPTNERINPYSLIEPRYDKTPDFQSSQVLQQYSNHISFENMAGKQNNILPITQTVNHISNPEIATTTTKLAVSEHHYFNPLNSFIYHHPNVPITQPKMINIENPLLNYNGQFKILLNYNQSNTHNQPKLVDYPQSTRDQQIINHKPNQQQQMIYQHPLQQQQITNYQPIQQHQMIYQQPLKEQQIINHQPIQQHQMIYQHPLQEQRIINHQPILQQQMIYQQPLQELQINHQPVQQQQIIYQQPLQEQQTFNHKPTQQYQMINHQPLQQQQFFYKQPLQEQQIIHQGQQIFYQQPLQETNIFYQQPILEQKSIYYQQPMQERQMTFQQPIQERQMTFQQPIQERQMTFQQPIQEQQMTFQLPIEERQMTFQQPIQERQMTFQQSLQEHPNSFQQLFQAEPQWQEHRMIYQQPMEEQRMMYQPQPFIGPTNCNVCP